MAIAKRSKDDAGSSAISGETKSGRVGKENMLWKGLLRKDELEKLATEFSGDGDFIVCPGYKGPYQANADKWGRLYLPGAAASYRVARATLSKWRDKTADEKYSWWPEELKKRGLESVKASDIKQSLHIATWNHYVDVYHKASKVRVGARIRQRRIREVALERDDDANAAGALVALADVPASSTSEEVSRPS